MNPMEVFVAEGHIEVFFQVITDATDGARKVDRIRAREFRVRLEILIEAPDSKG